MRVLSALLNKQIAQTRNIGKLLRQQSPFKVLFIICFAVAFEAGLWGIFRDGFNLLDSLGGAGTMITMRLFSLFFFGMGLMLILSSIVTTYSTIFRSPEIPFLIVRPISLRQIALYKFMESTALSSWAFFFIIIPFVGSYAMHRRMSLDFIAWTFVFSIPFLMLCSGIGSIFTLNFVRWFPNSRSMRRALALSGVACAIALWWFSRGIYSAIDNQPQFNLGKLIPGLAMASSPLLPSWWVSEGIMAFSHNEGVRGGLFLGLVLTTAALVCFLIEWLGETIFYDGWQKVLGSDGNVTRKPVLLGALDRAMARIISADIKAMIMKDIRTFLRDPMQWSQALIFFGLLGLYYANVRSFHYNLLPDSWRNTVAFLNVFSVAAVMCSLGGRFIYPQLSLEGQGFWIVGLSPMTMNRVLLTKFFLSLAGMLAISSSLMVLSSNMLEASRLTTWIAIGLSVAISFAVCALSTGLGAIFLNLEQRNPAAIVSGFGGTLNLVLSLGFMLAVIIPFGFVLHLHNTGRLAAERLGSDLVYCSLWLAMLTILATVVPLFLGARSLRQREF